MSLPDRWCRLARKQSWMKWTPRSPALGQEKENEGVATLVTCSIQAGIISGNINFRVKAIALACEEMTRPATTGRR